MVSRHGVVLLCVLLAACAPVEPETNAERDRLVEGVPRTLPPNTVEGVEDALRVYLPDPDVPWVPGVTRWREAELDLPPELTDPAGRVESHGQLTLLLVDAVVDADEFGGPVQGEFSFPWEVSTRVHRTGEDEALAIVQQWGGLGDDSVSGIDYLFTLRLGPAGWYVAEVAQREQCTRNERLPGEEDLPEFCV
jgi:hypothetical protein